MQTIKVSGAVLVLEKISAAQVIYEPSGMAACVEVHLEGQGYPLRLAGGVVELEQIEKALAGLK